MSSELARAVKVLASLVLVFGLIALVGSSGAPFAGPEGRILPVQAGFYSPLGALVVIALAAIGLLGGVTRAVTLVYVSAFGFSAAALLVLVQVGSATNWLGGRGSTMSFLMAAGVGLLALALASRSVESGTRVQPTQP